MRKMPAKNIRQTEHKQENEDQLCVINYNDVAN